MSKKGWLIPSARYTDEYSGGNFHYLVIHDSRAGNPDVFMVMVLTSGDPVIIGRELPYIETRKVIKKFEKAGKKYDYCGERSVVEQVLQDIGRKRRIKILNTHCR